MVKKLVALLLALTLFIPCSHSAIVANAKTMSTEEFKYNTIIDEILMLDRSITASNDDLYVVSVPKQGTSRGQTSTRESSELAIRMVTQNNAITEVTTFFPYKTAENGDMINSFEYSPKNTRDTGTFTSHLVDTVVATTVYYNKERSAINLITYYRHLGVRATWTSNNSNVSVSKFKIDFESYGDLHKYPECMTQTQYQSMIQADYSITSKIDKTNPYNGQICVSLDPMMPENRMLDFADGMWHGGLLTVDITYVVNGMTRTYRHQYDPYL